MALMELMILHPELPGKEIGAMVQLSKSRTSAIMHDPVFVLALEKYREQHSDKVSDLRAELDNQIKDATRSAIQASKEIIEHKGDDMPIVVKQASISQILAQGHAKAIERSAHMEIPVPQELIRELLSVSREMLTPLVPVKRLEKIHEEDSEIVDVPTN
jgi:hypothetical protein